MQVYLDNAATTITDEKVLQSMMPYLTNNYGNASSVHSHGRVARSAIEKARKKIAELLSTSPSQIYFNSGGTEGDNTALWGLVRSYKAEHLITSKIEHHAVLHTAQYISKTLAIPIHYVPTDTAGNIDVHTLEKHLKQYPKSVVSLMHANNEIGNLTDIAQVTAICHAYGAKYHSDTVQTMGYYPFNLQKLPIDVLVASAHKFHGPKGIGFLYIGEDCNLEPYLHGGMQERNLRGGTENVAAIVGMASALEIALENLENIQFAITQLKEYAITKIREMIPRAQFNGESENLTKSHYKILSVRFPQVEMADMLLFGLDIKGISVSGGSACNSGALAGSHVLEELHGQENQVPSVRISFSKYNTLAEIDYCIRCIREQLQVG